MVQPSTGDQVLGGVVEGAIVAARVEGELHRVVDAEAGGESRFTPMVVNHAGRPLRVAVLAGDDSLDCDCRISAGDSLRLGYYRYGRPHRAPGDRSRRLEREIHRFRRPARLGQRRGRRAGGAGRPPPAAARHAPPGEARSKTAPERRNPLESFLPVR